MDGPFSGQAGKGGAPDERRELRLDPICDLVPSSFARHAQGLPRRVHQANMLRTQFGLKCTSSHDGSKHSSIASGAKTTPMSASWAVGVVRVLYGRTKAPSSHGTGLGRPSVSALRAATARHSGSQPSTGRSPV